jgi:hypothetical protein
MNLTVVRGDATAEELAAMLAVLSRPRRVDLGTTGYERWRRGRLRALGHTQVNERRHNG